MSKKSHHFLMLWPWPLTYDLEKLIRSGHYHYQCVYQIWEQSIQWFLSYRVNTIAGGGRRAAGGGRRAAGGGRLRHKTITSPDPSDTGDIIMGRNMEYRVMIIDIWVVPWKKHFPLIFILKKKWEEPSLADDALICHNGSDKYKRTVTSLMNNLVSQRPGYMHDHDVKMNGVQLWRVWT